MISIITILMGILLPALAKIRRQARTILGTRNQEQIAVAVNCYAFDNGELYPESVATIGTQQIHWNWQEPMMMIGHRKRSPQMHRAVSEYLGSYISNSKTMFCPNAPEKYRYLQKAWQTGDGWDNPETAPPKDPLIGTYCFYWNYIGCLEDGQRFRGPSRSYLGYHESKLLVSCYFGYGHWRSPKAFSGCDDFKGADITAETWVSSAYWSSEKCENTSKKMPEIKLNAAYIDGHVESYSSRQTIPMRVSIRADGSEAYPDGIGPGIIYIPKSN